MKKVGSLIRQLLPRRDVPLRQNERAQKLLLLLLTPLTAFWLMQLVLGSPPWNMSVGVALANWLCLSALYWIGCAIIGYPAVCCALLHILAGMWGAANYFVSVFRGTPILPWDFKALGTAVAVAGSYSLSMTWQIAICIMLVTLLAWALRPYYKMGHFRLRKGDLLTRFRADCRSAVSHPNRPPANTGHVRRRDRRVGSARCVPDRRCRCRISAKHRIYGSGKTG